MNLEARYAGLKLKNPVIVASATPTMDLEGLKRSVDCGAGALVTKSVVFPKPYAPGVPYKTGERCGPNPRPRFRVVNKDIEFDRSLYNKGGYYSLWNMLEPYPTPQEWVSVMEKIKKYTDIPIIISICAAEGDYEEWQRLAKIVEEQGADAIELSMHHMPYTNKTDPLLIKAVKEVVKVPVVGKPMFPAEDPVATGRLLAENGADGITAIGNQPLKGVEIDTDTESLAMVPSSFSVRGPWFRPVGLHWILQLAKTTNLPLSGVTGVASYKDVVKYLLCGASSVQVCSAMYVEGYEIIPKLIKGLEKWMEEHGYNSIEEFRGKAVSQWVPAGALSSNPPKKAVVNESCTACGLCKKVCYFQAIEVEDTAKIDPAKCDGCGLCYSICSFKAIDFKEV